MHSSRRTQTGTRRHQLNNHSNFQLTANQINHTEMNSHTNLQPKNFQKVDNKNNDCNQTFEGQDTTCAPTTQ